MGHLRWMAKIGVIKRMVMDERLVRAMFDVAYGGEARYSLRA